MGITLSGFNSGLPVDDIIAKLMDVERRPVTLLEQRKATIQQQQTAFNTAKTKVTDLQTAVKALIDKTSGKNLFKTKKATVDDAYKSIVSATVSETASAQTIQLEVVSLATATKAASTGPVGAYLSGGTLLEDVSQGALTEGTFTIYVDGQAHSINVTKDGSNDVDDVLSQILAASPDITGASVGANGKINITFNAPHTVQLGSASDSSNFLSATRLQTGVNTGTSIESSADNSIVNNNQLMSSLAANLTTPVTDGTFTIGTTTFDTTGKTLNQMISEINNSSGAGVTATFNMSTNKLQLISKTPGSALINLQEGTSNFLTAVGLVSGGDSTASQTAGANAEFVLNGTTLYSSTNSVDESVTGITGVTLNLLKGQPGTTVTITIGNDTSQLKTSIQDFVKKYNDVINYINDQTNAEQKKPLAGESVLLQFRSQLRQTLASAVSALGSTAYDSLQMIGITTGAVTGTAALKSTLEFDAAKFDAAVAAEPETVRKLFAGKDETGALDGTSSDDNMDGIMTQMSTLLSSALLSSGDSKGLFPAYDESAAARIKSINEAISRGEDRLVRKEKLLRAQFTAMEKMIGMYQSQGSALAGLNKQLSSNGK